MHAGGQNMTQTKQVSIAQLREAWINNHVEVRKLEQEIKTAHEQAIHPEWNADPILFCRAAYRALKLENDARSRLFVTKAELKRQFQEKLNHVLKDGNNPEMDSNDE